MLLDKLKYSGKSFARGLGEYFLGLETHKSYQARRNFAREFIAEEDKLKNVLKSLNRCQTTDSVMGKIIPNLIDAIAIGSIIADNSNYLSAGGCLIGAELIRFFVRSNSSSLKNNLYLCEKDTVRQALIFEKREEEEEEDLEGEEWKRGTDYEDKL